MLGGDAPAVDLYLKTPTVVLPAYANLSEPDLFPARVEEGAPARQLSSEGEAAIIAAPAPVRLVSGSPIGISVWGLVLLDKFFFQRPTYRLLAELESYGISLARSTLTEGMERLAPLFKPLAEGIRERVRIAPLRQADETGWFVFVEHEGKTGHRWQLWVFLCEDAVYFKLDPTRSAKVVEEVLGTKAEGIVVVDRYSAYKAFVVRSGGKLLLAFCWAHYPENAVIWSALTMGLPYP